MGVYRRFSGKVGQSVISDRRVDSVSGPEPSTGPAVLTPVEANRPWRGGIARGIEESEQKRDTARRLGSPFSVLFGIFNPLRKWQEAQKILSV
jgi:hypothetical protein